ncbi:hypothetical protein M9Y10_038487 [Tritrichomonas musculus]|uniref:Uncharacterized protein n=1 Tax=Tritrichomonas musculus TaxID=1915356 RepID=A0ABR2K955_9EUKA
MESLTIPQNVELIGGSAFSGCGGLISIIIPSKVTSIIAFLFNECYNLKTVK